MRDAIGGLLSMSRMGGFHLNKGTSFNEENQSQRQNRVRHNMLSDDTGENMPTCFRDDEFGTYTEFFVIGYDVV